MKTTVRRVAKIAIFSGLVLSLPFAAATTPSFLLSLPLLSSGYLGVKDVCRRWGEQPLDIAAFRAAEEDEATRAAMACSLLETKDDYIGMHRLEVRPLFGNPTGYYITEFFPTYIIETAKTMSEDSWQIVFLIDRNGKVSDIIVHKNCC